MFRTRILLAAFASLALSLGPATAANLLTNAGSDTDLSGWSEYYATASVDWDAEDELGNAGSGSARVTGSPTYTSTRYLISDCVSITPSTPIVFGASIGSRLQFAVEPSWGAGQALVGPAGVPGRRERRVPGTDAFRRRVLALPQKLSVEAPCLTTSSMAGAPAISTPSARSSAV